MRLLSVVVPTHDTRELTLRCVDAALASRLPEGTVLEIVVVDDGSRDATGEALAGREGVRVVRNEEPAGFAGAANRGVSETRGEVVVLLNSDAEVEPDSLAAVASAFAADGNLGIAGAALRYPDGTPQWSAGREPDLLWLFAQASGLPALLGRVPGWRRVKPLHVETPADVGWVSGAAMALRTAVWRAHGPLDASFAFYVQDLDFCFRARAGGWRVRLLPAFRAMHRQGATITSNGNGTVDNLDLGLLWLDFVSWACKRGGPSFAARARTAILAGSGLRLAARRAALPFLSEGRRRDWKTVTALLATARSRLLARGAGGRVDPSTAG
ncbi:MAG: glycosyltransferase [Thermoanaerobaculia bacterium]|nr:glycosyltransferase [Thermoanaerobaculia bacterium]